MIELVIQQIINGVSIGGTYALMALGLTLIYGILYQANFAHCEQYVIAGYVMFVLIGLGVPYIGVLIPTLTAGLVLGWLYERLIYRPFRESSHSVSVLAFFAVGLILSNACSLYFGTPPRAVPVPFGEGMIRVGGIVTTVQRVLTIGVTVGLSVAVYFFVEKTRTGKALRAMSQDLHAAKLMGVDLDRIGMVTFMLGGMMAALAAFLIIPIYMVSPGAGLPMVIRAFMIIIAGGLGNISGAVVFGFILGVIESLLGGLIYSPLRDVAGPIFLLLLLWIRPQGLMGRPVVGV